MTGLICGQTEPVRFCHTAFEFARAITESVFRRRFVEKILEVVLVIDRRIGQFPLERSDARVLQRHLRRDVLGPYIARLRSAIVEGILRLGDALVRVPENRISVRQVSTRMKGGDAAFQDRRERVGRACSQIAQRGGAERENAQRIVGIGLLIIRPARVDLAEGGVVQDRRAQDVGIDAAAPDQLRRRADQGRAVRGVRLRLVGRVGVGFVHLRGMIGPFGAPCP